MNILKQTIILGLGLFVLSCQHKKKKINFLILPTPRESTISEKFSLIAPRDLIFAYSPKNDVLPKLFHLQKHSKKLKKKGRYKFYSKLIRI